MAFHLYGINELYSNADGTIQFIELTVGNANGESFWQGQSITVTQGATAHLYTFPTNLPSTQTANTKVLIATQGFADLGIVTPDFIVFPGFLYTSGGATVNFAGVDFVSYSLLPTNGTSSINRSGTIGVNSPTDFAGNTGTVPGNPIAGTAGADTLTGTGSNDFIVGVGGNDTLTGGSGNDILNGGAGIDTAVFSSNRANFSLAPSGGNYVVTDRSGAEGTDTLISVERLRFADANVALDTGATQSAGATALLIGAVLPEQLVYDVSKQALLGAVIGLFDQGYSLKDLSGAVMRLDIWGILANGGNPGATNTQIANYLLTNVNGVAPDATAVAAGAAALDREVGALQGDFLFGLASSSANQTHIGLVGLASTGLVYTG